MEVLTLLFVALKLTHVVDWSWFAVLLPTIIELGVGAVFLVVWGLVALHD